MARTSRSPRYVVVTDIPIQPKACDDDRIVAVALLTERDLAMLGQRFHRVFPVDSENDEFSCLLRAIDAADRRHRNPPP